MFARCNSSSWRQLRGDCRIGEGDVWRRACRAPIRPAGSAQFIRPNTRARRKAHGMGLLSRSQRIGFRYAAQTRSADRTVRTGFCGLYSRAKNILSRRARGDGRKPDRRRHQWWRHGHPAIPVSSDGPRVRDVGTRRLPVFVVYAARWRRPRNVRLSRRKNRDFAARCLIYGVPGGDARLSIANLFI